MNLSFPLLPETSFAGTQINNFLGAKIGKENKIARQYWLFGVYRIFTDTNHTPTDILIVGRVNKNA